MERVRLELLSIRVRLLAAAGLLVATTAAVVAGCEAFGGHPSGEPAAAASGPALANGVECLGTCVADPGSRPVDCTQPSQVDTLPIVNFDNVSVANGNYVAQGLYTYSDGTAQTLYAMGTQQDSDAGQSGYQPLTQETDLCWPGNHGLHVFGGYVPADRTAADPTCSQLPRAAQAYKGYGGGIGISMQKLNSSDESVRTLFTGNSTNTNPMDPSLPTNKNCYCSASCATPNPSVCPPASEEYAVRVAALDVSAYEGVAFWARRGPNSQEGVAVTVGDRYTDDDLSYLTYLNDAGAPRHCERVRQCSCSNLKPCVFQGANPEPLCTAFNPPVGEQGGSYCLPLDLVGFQSISGQGSNVFCGPTECDQPYAAYPNIDIHGGETVSAVGGQDPAFYARQCNPYTWPNGVGASFCYNPGVDPPPADPTQQCGDHWMKMVSLDTDWKYYRIPFTDLRQQGFAKKSEKLDLHAVSVVRFTWTNGFIDYWIDEVSFYRAKQ